MTNDFDDTPDERYARDLVDAAIGLPVVALPLAHGLLEALDADAMPSGYQFGLLCVLRRLGNTAPTPALRMLRAALAAGSQPGAPWDAAQCSPEWLTLCASGQDGCAVAALTFMHQIATANVQRLQRAQAALDPVLIAACATVAAATSAAS